MSFVPSAGSTPCGCAFSVRNTEAFLTLPLDRAEKSFSSVPAVRGRFSGLPRTQSRASRPRECFWRAKTKPPALLAETRVQLQRIISWLTHLYPQKIFHPYPVSDPASTSPSLSPTSRARFRRPGTRELEAGRRAPPATTTGSCGTPPAATPPAAHRDSAR
ncbi:hypothetical protein SORBI_3009G004800 [Sorghum bicolor]|uniref:Uncharacterized protein n=1 Tax=Sorghum bicolor TaxID=4558 RepID=C5YY15_SORBI|nr:hypothetical protein SORBI_3009G004800 [Sorghum bicolor]